MSCLMDMVRLGPSGGGIALFHYFGIFVLCLLLDYKQDWTTQGAGNPEQPPDDQPPTGERHRFQAGLQHHLCVPAG